MKNKIGHITVRATPLKIKTLKQDPLLEKEGIEKITLGRFRTEDGVVFEAVVKDFDGLMKVGRGNLAHLVLDDEYMRHGRTTQPMMLSIYKI